jgi:hypothetical protein
MRYQALTVVMYVAAVSFDWFTSLVGIERGHPEANPLYDLLGGWFWLLYLVVNAGLLVLLLVCSERWWWTYLILWIPIIAHVICGVHNLGLLGKL